MKSTISLLLLSSVLLFSCGTNDEYIVETTVMPEVSVLATVETIPETVPETTTTVPATTVPKLETTIQKTTTTLQKPVKQAPKNTTTIPKSETTAPKSETTIQKPVSGGVESVIRSAAAEFGVSGDRMVRVARCESTLNPNAKNGKFGGLFQFSDTTFNWFASMSGLGGSKWNASDASRMASWAFANGYASHWECK